jgi:hypothetical protein
MGRDRMAFPPPTEPPQHPLDEGTRLGVSHAEYREVWTAAIERAPMMVVADDWDDDPGRVFTMIMRYYLGFRQLHGMSNPRTQAVADLPHHQLVGDIRHCPVFADLISKQRLAEIKTGNGGL